MGDTEKPVLAPTPTRIRLAADIAAELVRAYHFINGIEVRRTYDDRQVSDRVALFVSAGLADYRTPDKHNYSIVSLTPAGEDWLTKYGASE